MPNKFLSELHAGRKIIINPFFNQMPDNPRYRPGDPHLFSHCNSRVYHLDLSANQHSNAGVPVDGSIKLGAGPDPNLVFQWLPFVGGSVTFTALSNAMPTLTGPMTGCWLGTFKMNGADYLGHVGTDSNSVANTEDVKSAWKIASNHQIINGPHRAFKPSDRVACALILGAVEADGKCFNLGFDSMPGNVYTVRRVLNEPAPLPKPNFT